MVKKVLSTLDKGTPHKDRLLLVAVWAIFAAVVVNDFLIAAALGLW